MHKDTDLVKWNPSDERLISRYIDLLMGILFVDNDGRAKTTEGFNLDVYLKILSESVALKEISSAETKRGLIRKAVFLRLKHYQRQDIYTFRRALATELRAYLSQPSNKHWILIPLHLPRNELGNARSISILGTKLLFRDWKYVQQRFKFAMFLKDTRNQLRDQRFTYSINFTPVLALTEGRNIREALDEAERPFSFLRWLINLSYQFGRVTYSWGGYPKPLGLILPPPTFGVFSENGEYEQLFYSLTKYEEYKQNKLDPRVLPQVRKLSMRLKGPTGEDKTLSLLTGALEKYGEALDTIESRHAFLLLWQILELIALQSSDMNTVKNRIINLLGQDPTVRDLLSALYRTRNLLVHRGSFPDEQGLREVNLLKYIVERAINKLFSLIRICPTKASLERYYQYMSANDAELTDRHRIIGYLRRIRWRR
jgi:hypothetical protein